MDCSSFPQNIQSGLCLSVAAMEGKKLQQLECKIKGMDQNFICEKNSLRLEGTELCVTEEGEARDQVFLSILIVVPPSHAKSDVLQSCISLGVHSSGRCMKDVFNVLLVMVKLSSRASCNR